jgi:hypothetical protein
VIRRCVFHGFILIYFIWSIPKPYSTFLTTPTAKTTPKPTKSPFICVILITFHRARNLPSHAETMGTPANTAPKVLKDIK